MRSSMQSVLLASVFAALFAGCGGNANKCTNVQVPDRCGV